MGKKTPHFKRYVVAPGIVVIAAALAWRALGFPMAFDEAVFASKLSYGARSSDAPLQLARMMPGDWELVCSAHVMRGFFHLKQYNKDFIPVSGPQPDDWGLLFISKDGSVRGANAGCATMGIHIAHGGCVERKDARLVPGTPQASCRSFTLQK